MMKVKTDNKENVQKSPFSIMEDEVSDFWKKGDIFKKLVAKDAPKGDYVFYDGPPFATGLPHYGHVVASIIKDVVPRYWTMNGYRVERKWGWDCHGLPIENIVEKELGTKSKKDIETMGVAKFNELCRSKVSGYVDEWKKVIAKLGRWADMEDDYKTMDLEFMESVWWVFKTMYDKGLIYKSYRSMHVCPRCETTLSQSEVAEGYKDVKDLSAIAKFELINVVSSSSGSFASLRCAQDDKVYILAWTTTPWTLIGNVALAVGESIKYQLLSIKGEEAKYIIAEDRVSEVFKDKEIDVIKNLTGSDLLGLKYKPLFDYYSKDENLENRENGWQVYAGDFVTTNEGTGVVHIAPAFGEDDMNLGKKENLPFVQHLTIDGNFKLEVIDFPGLNVKPKGDHMATDIEIIKYLAHNNLLFHKEKYEHSYPHCWRCDTPLLNYATSSWFVNVTKIKDQMLENAKVINWSPEHIKEGRWGNWLEGARDWSISRQRYWASVMPIWECACGERKVVGSISDLEKEVDLGCFHIMRHGEAKCNVERIYDSTINPENSLTTKGKKEVSITAQKMKDLKIDLIICSDHTRTKETAEIVAKEIGAVVIEDKRIREVEVGSMNGLPYDMNFITRRSRGENLSYPQGESWTDVKRRMDDFYLDVSYRYKDKNILIVSHGDALLVLEASLKKGNFLGNIKKINEEGDYIKKAELRELKHRIVDIHKHIVDEIELSCQVCGKKMKRIPDVIDTWFDSGSMPFAQMHYPFENKEKFEQNFPAQFIAEGADQTRCWFYYMHVLAAGTKGVNAFNNVIVNGIVLAEDGKKMAKKEKNYPDPMLIFDKYGADALRHYLLTSPVMLADTLCFAEKGVQESLRKINMLLWNVVKFYEMFTAEQAAKDEEQVTPSDNILDKWILARLGELIKTVTKEMEKYDLPGATRPIAGFIDDLSTWYIRRSRDRFKSGREADKKNAIATTRYVLLELSKIMAPFTPFIAEQVWQKISGHNFENMEKSVHLEQWIAYAGNNDEDSAILLEMGMARKIIELGLAKRDEHGIKIRQPLAKLKVKSEKLKVTGLEQYLDLVKDELNIKQIEFIDVDDGDLSVELDTEISEDLKLEGIKRELVRTINSMRKNDGLTIDDKIDIRYQSDSEAISNVFEKFKADILSDTLAVQIIDTVEDCADKKSIMINGEETYLEIKSH
jgi:isoleucyl-tRNA synthetase